MDEGSAAEDTPVAVEIGRRIAQARKELSMRQEELAELIRVSVRSMQAYESGEVIPYRKLSALERVLGRDRAWLLHGDLASELPDTRLHVVLESIARVEQKLDRLIESQQVSRECRLGDALDAWVAAEKGREARERHNEIVRRANQASVAKSS